MTTFKNTLAGAGVALMALVSLALPMAPAFAADLADYGYGDYYSDGGSDYGYGDYYSDSYDYGYGDYYADDYDYGYGDYYADDYGYGDYYSTPSYGGGGSGGGFSMPTFGGGGYSYAMPTFGTANASARASIYNSNTNTLINTNTNTCVNDSCNYVDNSVTDNSVKISESRRERERVYQDDCYNTYSYGYNNCYQQPRPIAYNTTPYITLSQTPYTGLDLGPMGEVLYWTFLVLWCLGAAYLIVVKRVQNKLVGFLNGFLFGTSGAAVAHTAHTAHATHAPAHTGAAVSAPLVEEGIDPFIQSQIKRS